MTVCVGLSECCTRSNLNFYFAFTCTNFIASIHKISWVIVGLLMSSSWQWICKSRWNPSVNSSELEILKKEKKKCLGKSPEQKCFVKSFPVFWYFNKDHMIWGLFLVMILNSGCHFCESLPYKGQTFVLLAMIC